MNIDFWILTFERPLALDRLITQFGKQGVKVNVFSNSPHIELNKSTFETYSPSIIVNSLNDRNSSSWCARAWNSIFLKGFQNSDALVCIQDDTNISDDFIEWLENVSQQNDFISGPTGDQFFYIHKKVFQKIGWWDERYLGCYCGDADYFKRVYLGYDKTRVSIQDTHNWGTIYNPCGVMDSIITTFESKTIDPNYDNQHWVLEKLCESNPTLQHSQGWYRRKWGIDLDINASFICNGVDKIESDVNWYPSHSKILGVTAYD